MTHTRQLDDHEGDFAAWQLSAAPCPKCAATQTRCRCWESSDGAFEDYQYRCGACGFVWWIDGIDS